jgi:uncharacterized membrane protein YfcA
VPTWLEVALTLVLGFATGLLSGMFGLGGAVISTPGIRVLGATALQAVGSTLPSILPSSISGSFRYQREQFIRWRIVAVTAAFGVPASVAGSRLSDSVPGNGHLLMLLTAALVGYTAYGTANPRATKVAATAHEDWWRFAVIGIGAGCSRACSVSAAASSWCRCSRPGSASISAPPSRRRSRASASSRSRAR